MFPKEAKFLANTFSYNCENTQTIKGLLNPCEGFSLFKGQTNITLLLSNALTRADLNRLVKKVEKENKYEAFINITVFKWPTSQVQSLFNLSVNNLNNELDNPKNIKLKNYINKQYENNQINKVLVEKNNNGLKFLPDNKYFYDNYFIDTMQYKLTSHDIMHCLENEYHTPNKKIKLTVNDFFLDIQKKLQNDNNSCEHTQINATISLLIKEKK